MSEEIREKIRQVLTPPLPKGSKETYWEFSFNQVGLDYMIDEIEKIILKALAEQKLQIRRQIAEELEKFTDQEAMNKFIKKLKSR